ncbi:MAG: carboxypeptidase-like regulatory domain-containing protein [Sphingobacteriales bacterium]|nr:carboxypeptidase-like regulatory domain-containing protein [Sphingobacteriales bacterium]
MKTLFFSLFLCLSIIAQAQTGEIQGKITDAKSGEPLPFVNVSLIVNGSMAAAQTDFEGYYSIKPIPAGEYSVKASLVGYDSQQTDKVLVRAGKITFVDMQIAESSSYPDTFRGCYLAYKVPLMQPDETSTGYTYNHYDIRNMPLWCTIF